MLCYTWYSRICIFTVKFHLLFHSPSFFGPLIKSITISNINKSRVQIYLRKYRRYLFIKCNICRASLWSLTGSLKTTRKSKTKKSMETKFAFKWMYLGTYRLHSSLNTLITVHAYRYSLPHQKDHLTHRTKLLPWVWVQPWELQQNIHLDIQVQHTKQWTLDLKKEHL